MTKKFNIHDWQAKRRNLTEGYIGDDSLEDVMKRGTADTILWHVATLTDAGILGSNEKEDALKALGHPSIDQDLDTDDFNKWINDPYLEEQDLTEHTVNFSKKDMANLHKKGKIKKKDDTGKEHTYVYKGDLDEQDNFDSRFKDAMSGAGFSDDEQDDIMSRDIGSPFPGSEDKDFDEDDVRAIEDKAISLGQLDRQRYMVDIILPIDIPLSGDEYEDEKTAEKIADFYRKKMEYPEAYTGTVDKRLRQYD